MNPPPVPVTAYLLLGANLGDCRTTLASACGALAAHGAITHLSGVYQTAPWGGAAVAGQPPYLNQAVALLTLLDPFGLLRVCQTIEQAYGRTRAQPWAARTLDIDILLFGGFEVEFFDELILPHPRLTQRRFALTPLAEIAPEVLVPSPLPRRTVAEWLAVCADPEAVERV